MFKFANLKVYENCKQTLLQARDGLNCNNTKVMNFLSFH